MTQVLLCGAGIVTLSMGIRHGFGLWLQPITMYRGWTRETFAFAIAIQNLAWGVAGPVAGGLADRYGAFKVLIVGSLLYALGLVLMALATSGLAFTGSAGVLLGLAQSGTTYAVVYGVIGRNVAPEKRSWAMGVAAPACRSRRSPSAATCSAGRPTRRVASRCSTPSSTPASTSSTPPTSTRAGCPATAAASRRRSSASG